VSQSRQDAPSSLTIGEVLSLLQEEFPEISISKIRFLESQGLIEPERTPSGYRKFHPHDIERLRWILRQQRDNFLPLRVIRDKLDHDDEADPAPSDDGDGGAADVATDEEQDGTSAPDPGRASPLRVGPSTVSLTRDELAAASGLDIGAIVELERFGLVVARAIGPSEYYDGEALAVARLAAAMRSYGVDARHLRMYKSAADREAGVYEQVVLPLVRQRNPAARQRARATLDELAGLGQSLHQSLLRQALRGYLEA
jgi:DNA-binding transcriptional MerR regulator